MNMYESLAFNSIASIVKYFKTANIGLPIEILQTTEEVEPDSHPGRVQLLISGPDFNRDGTRGEYYADIMLQAYISSQVIPNDIYFHARIKARMIGIMEQVIPIYDMNAVGSPKPQVAIIVPMKHESIQVMPAVIQPKHASTIVRQYTLEVCQ